MPLTNSKRQLIVEAVDTRLKTILTAGGVFQTNLGQNIFWYRSRLDSAGLPALVCRDRLNQDWATAGRWIRTLAVEMEVYLAPATTPDLILRQALSDIEIAVGQDVTWGGLAEDTRMFEGEKVGYDDWESVIIASGFFLTVEYTTDPWNPRA
jgi:hypothetical protein